MNFYLSNKVIIEDPTPEMLAYCIDKMRFVLEREKQYLIYILDI